MPSIPLYIAVSNAICDEPNHKLLQHVKQQIDQSPDKPEQADLNRALRLAVTIDDVSAAKANIDYLLDKGADIKAAFNVAGLEYSLTQLTTSDLKPLDPAIIQHLNDKGADLRLGAQVTQAPSKPR